MQVSYRNSYGKVLENGWVQLTFLCIRDRSLLTREGGRESVQMCEENKAVASLTGPSGQEFHFPHFFPQISIIFLNFSSNFTNFLPHFGSPGGRVAHPGKPWLSHWKKKYLNPCYHEVNSHTLLLENTRPHNPPSWQRIQVFTCFINNSNSYTMHRS